MASAYLKVLQEVKDRECPLCRGRGKLPDDRTMCTECYGTGFESRPESNDRHSVEEIVQEMFGSMDEDPSEGATIQLEFLLSATRFQAVGWTWTEACAQYDQGRDPRLQELPVLLDKSVADLNPAFNKEDR